MYCRVFNFCSIGLYMSIVSVTYTIHCLVKIDAWNALRSIFLDYRSRNGTFMTNPCFYTLHHLFSPYPHKLAT
jgi:hypothetical protein